MGTNHARLSIRTKKKISKKKKSKRRTNLEIEDGKKENKQSRRKEV